MARAWKRSAPRWIASLRERDGDNCQLCHEPIDFSLDIARDDWAASVDHIKPQAAGGSHSLVNLRLAHRKCNNKRGSVWEGVDYSARRREQRWDDWAAAHQPAGGRVLCLGDEPVLPCS